VLGGDTLEPLLARAGVQRETLVDRGLAFTRRRGDRPFYFIRNPGPQDVSGWLPLASPGPAALIFDPMTGKRGAAPTRTTAGVFEVNLTLPRGQSLIVATAASTLGVPAFEMFSAAGAPVAVAGPWQVSFIDGGPDRPANQAVPSLTSWTSFAGDAGRRFSGTARYTARFPRPAADAAAWRLDLGAVHESARVKLNGRDLGVLIGPLFQLTLDRAALAADNTLEIDVANLMANRIAAMDKAGTRWRTFYNVNIQARLPQNRGADGLFSAASWEPLDSGLLGPVTVTPLARRR
jgi:hypothetical protein